MRTRLGGLIVLAACGGSNERTAAPASPSTTDARAAGSAAPAGTAATDDAPAASGPFDRAAAARVLSGVDPSSCYEKPPFLDGQLHVDLTIMPNGRVTEANADPPYANTEAGRCAEALFRGLRVPPYVGPPVRMGRTVPHAPIRGKHGDAPFDPSTVRASAAAQDLSECVDLPSGGVDRGRATIAVMPSGDVRNVTVDAPLGLTPRGECVARILRSMMFRPYAGEPAPSVTVEFEVKKRN